MKATLPCIFCKADNIEPQEIGFDRQSKWRVNHWCKKLHISLMSNVYDTKTLALNAWNRFARVKL